MQLFKELRYYILAAVATLLFFDLPETTSPESAVPVASTRDYSIWQQELRGLIEDEYRRNGNADSVMADALDGLSMELYLDVPVLQFSQKAVVRQINMNRRY